jgi:hypothetical protein
MTCRSLVAASVLLGASMARAEQGVVVSVCYSEFPGSSCSFTEAPFHHPTLEGPIPSAQSRTPEFQFGETYHRFTDVPAGNYIVRTGGCNPFGCFLDVAVDVRDADAFVHVPQIGPQTPTRSPIPTPTAVPFCLGDGNADDRVTIDELVEAVGNALNGCPP